MRPVQALVGQGAGVEPLGEVLEVGGVALGEGEGGGDGFAEGVGRVEGGGEEGRDGAEGLKVEVEWLISGANREGDRCLEQVSVIVKYAIHVAAGRGPYLVGVDGVGSARLFGTVLRSSFVLTTCFFFIGISSSLVIPGIGGTILVDNRSK